jgi:hypothetical protein
MVPAALPLSTVKVVVSVPSEYVATAFKAFSATGEQG